MSELYWKIRWAMTVKPRSEWEFAHQNRVLIQVAVVGLVTLELILFVIYHGFRTWGEEVWR